MQNIYEYLCTYFDFCGDANKSDFENFSDICASLVNFSGNNIYLDVHKRLGEYFGTEVQVCSENAEPLWRKFNGDNVYLRTNAEQTLTVRYITENDLIGAISLSNIPKFVSPNVYHISQVREKLNAQTPLTPDEHIMLETQKIRDRAIYCASRDIPLILDCRGTHTERANDIFKYLAHAKILPRVLLVCDTSSDIMCPRPMTDICLSDGKNTVKIAERAPIGNTVLLTKDADSLSSEFENLLPTWQKEGKAPEKMSVILEKYCTSP